MLIHHIKCIRSVLDGAERATIFWFGKFVVLTQKKPKTTVSDLKTSFPCALLPDVNIHFYNDLGARLPFVLLVISDDVRSTV